MTGKPELTMNNSSTLGDISSWLFGFIALAIGIINTFWGNDPGYGIFILLLSFLYFPPITSLIKKITGINIPLWAKVILGAFIIWSAVGVGELFDKIDLMMKDL